jgi:hypothetical protein
MTLKVTPGAGGGPWRLTIENPGETPMRIPADPRLLQLEVTPPTSAPEPTDKKKKAGPTVQRCVLPEDARPVTDEGSELVIPSRRAWSANVDPLFYCFTARERAALVAGASVKARFGWSTNAKGAASSPPFAVAPVGASVGKFSPTKTIEADAFTLPETVTTQPPAPGKSDKSDKSESEAAPTEGDGSVALSVPETLDSARGVDLPTTVTLTNTSERPLTVLYRPEMMGFTVSTPAGSVRCGGGRQVGSPIRELFSTVRPKGRLDMGVLITATCPPGTFDDPGLYRVLPRLDTTGASGRALGLKTWDSVAVGKKPLLVRIRNSRKATTPIRPTLD